MKYGQCAVTRKLGAVVAALGLSILMPAISAKAAVQLPAGAHRDLVYGKCRTCHDLQYLKDSKGITKAQWDGVLSTMQGLGLEISDSQRKDILEYLGTYLGPNPPAAAQRAESEQQVSGKQVFAAQCVSCHQSDGRGLPGEFPPLAGNDDLNRSSDFPALVVLNGLQGKIEVEGKSYDGQMPSFAFLSDAKIAAVVNFIRTHWGNSRTSGEEGALHADEVATLRKRRLSPAQVHAYRAQHSQDGS